MDDAARARILLNELHHAGYDVRAENGELIITAGPNAHPVDKPLLDYVAPYRAHLLQMLAAAGEVDRIRRDAAKGS